MNVAASTTMAPQTPGRTDPAAAAGAATTAEDAGGSPATAAGGDAQDFGKILSGSIRKGREDAQSATTAARRPLDPAAVGTVDVGTDAADASPGTDPRTPLDPGVVLDVKVDPAKAVAVDASRAIKPGDDPKDEPQDAVASDVAAQLALASQWAGLPAAPATTAPAATAHGETDTHDAGAKVADRRATTGRDAKARAAAITAVDLAQVQAAALPVAVGATAFAVDRNARSQATAGGSAVTAKLEAPKVDETARLAAPESKTVAIDRLFDLAGHASTTSSDPASIASSFVAQIAAQVSNAQASTGAVAAATTALREPVGAPAWSHELGQAAIRMATNDLQNASLRLNPEHLGPLDVQMRIDNGVAHLQFAAVHADTRHALESSRSTLDQMFADQGIKLGDWSVGHSSANGSFARNFGAASSQDDGNRPPTGEPGTTDADGIAATATARAMRPLGLVDTFA